MDFIERIFGIVPDAGTGSTEAAILIAAAVGLIAALWVKRRAGQKLAR
jgi:hypothetical protein